MSKNKSTQAYDDIIGFLYEAMDDTLHNIGDALEQAKRKTHELGNITQEEIHQIAEFVMRDVEHAAQSPSLAEENNANLKLRVFVQGGGWSGMSYGFTLDETQNEDDWDLEISGVKVLVDSMSGGYLQGAVIDYKDDVMGASFSISNPQAQTTCGCGSSFSPY